MDVTIVYLFREDNTCSFISPKRDENCELCETDTCTCNFQGQNIQAYLYQMAMEAIVFTVHQLRSNRSFLQRTRSLQNWRISVVYSPVLAGAYSAV